MKVWKSWLSEFFNHFVRRGNGRIASLSFKESCNLTASKALKSLSKLFSKNLKASMEAYFKYLLLICFLKVASLEFIFLVKKLPETPSFI